MKKIVFFSGKGGVGKTSCASAYALSTYNKGYRTLLVSTDPAHSTSDLFKCKPSEKINELKKGLHLLEINGELESKKYLERVLKSSQKIVSPVILEEIKNQIKAASISPGTHEAALFDKMGEVILDNDMYDYIIFDTAPTGHTLRLVKLPNLLKEWTLTLMKKRRKMLRLKEMKGFTRGLVEKDQVLKMLEKRHDKFKAIEEMFKDERCVFNLVMNPEYMALSESMRALKELKKVGIEVDSVIVNKCLPPEVNMDIWRGKVEEQESVLRSLKAEKCNLRYFYLAPNLNPKECMEMISKKF